MGAVLIGFVKWLTTIQNMAKQNKIDIHELKKTEIPEIQKKLDDMHEKQNNAATSIAKIEGQLDFLVDHAKKHQ